MITIDVEDIPFTLAFFSYFYIPVVFFDVHLFLLTIFEEFIFRKVYFMIYTNTIKTCLLSSLFYSLYSALFIPKIPFVLGYFIIGFIFSLASKKCTLVELCIHRYMINVYILSVMLY